MKPLAALAKEQLSEVGITVEIKEHAPDTYWSEAYTVEPFTVGIYAIDSTTFSSLVRATVLSTSFVLGGPVGRTRTSTPSMRKPDRRH